MKPLINSCTEGATDYLIYKGRTLVIDYLAYCNKWMVTDSGMIIKRYADTKEESIEQAKKAWDNWIKKEAKNG